jgi:hypothetical protein
VLLELFTSQGCSSCPPADALLRDLARATADVLPLAFHVTYWNQLGWRDPFSFEGATQRQRLYAARVADTTVYTPQLIVDGVSDVVGSDRAAVARAIARAQAGAIAAATLALARAGDEVAIEIGAGAGSGMLFLAGYDTEHQTAIGRGENGGRMLTEANIVRDFAPVALWSGERLRLRHKRPEGEKLAAFVQATDGRILAVARENDHAV